MKVKKGVLCLVFLTCFTFVGVCRADSVPNTQSDKAPDSMVALGDSISAGALAAYSRLNTANPLVVLKVLWDLVNSYFEGSLSPMEKKYLSWSTGIDPWRRINTHAFKLKNMNPNLKILNIAASGASSDDVVKKQIKAVSDWSKLNTKRAMPDYSTLLIGPNDVCSDSVANMTQPSVFEANIRSILSSLLIEGGDNKVLVADLPAMEMLPNYRDSSLLSYFKPFRKCGDFWSRIPYCKNLLRDFTPETQAIVAERVRIFNRILEDTVDEFRRKFGDRVRLAAVLHQNGFEASDLAVDCFHPNIDGQKIISKFTWEQSWWHQKWSSRKEIQFAEKTYDIDPEWEQK